MDGEVEGQIDIKGDLVVGDKGRIRGDALVANILVAGKVEGNIMSRGCIEITPTGYVKGECSARVLELWKAESSRVIAKWSLLRPI